MGRYRTLTWSYDIRACLCLAFLSLILLLLESSIIIRLSLSCIAYQFVHGIVEMVLFLRGWASQVLVSPMS